MKNKARFTSPPLIPGIIGLIIFLIIAYFFLPIVDTHCYCENTTIFTHTTMKNFEGFCEREFNCTTFNGIDIVGQMDYYEK